MHPYSSDIKKPKFTVAPISVVYPKSKVNKINITPQKSVQENSIVHQILREDTSSRNQKQINAKKVNQTTRNFSIHQHGNGNGNDNESLRENRQNFNSQNQSYSEHVYEPIHVSLLEPSLPSVKQKLFQPIRSFKASQLRLKVIRENKNIGNLTTNPASFMSSYMPFQENYRTGSIQYENVQFSGFQNYEQKGNETSPKKKKQKLSVISTAGKQQAQFDLNHSDQNKRTVQLSNINSGKEKKKFISNIDMAEDIGQENFVSSISES